MAVEQDVVSGERRIGLIGFLEADRAKMQRVTVTACQRRSAGKYPHGNPQPAETCLAEILYRHQRPNPRRLGSTGESFIPLGKQQIRVIHLFKALLCNV